MEENSPSPKVLYPEWQNEYIAALLEVDPKMLLERVAAAKTAIFNRLQAISHNPDSTAERRAIMDALAFLRILRGTILDFPIEKGNKNQAATGWSRAKRVFKPETTKSPEQNRGVPRSPPSRLSRTNPPRES
jgi:hypothetical protein